MRVVQVREPGAPFELVERPLPKPGPGKVRIKVEACGICHSDSYVAQGTFPGVHYPAVPGHEIAGHIDALGLGVTSWRASASVGSGAIAGSVTDAAAATSLPAVISRYQASTTTAAMPTT